MMGILVAPTSLCFFLVKFLVTPNDIVFAVVFFGPVFRWPFGAPEIRTIGSKWQRIISTLLHLG